MSTSSGKSIVRTTQIVCKTPLSEPFRDVMGEQDRNTFPIRLNFIYFSTRMVMDCGEPVRHSIWVLVSDGSVEVSVYRRVGPPAKLSS